MIDQPGIYDLTAEEYHADCCPEPSLSASIAQKLLGESPAHARQAHPRLAPVFEREEREVFDRGAAAHAYLLEGESGFALIDADDWRTKAAKEARDEARRAGKIPLLRFRFDEVLEMATAANLQLDAHKDQPRCFSDGKPEQTIIWREGSIWCRARLDWLRDDRLVADDYKSTAASAHPDAWVRTAYGMGADVQEAFYRRAVKAVTGKEPRFRFVVQENYAPFALSVIALDPGAQMIADRKVEKAIALWSECVAADRWPAYPTQTCHVAIPAYEEARWIEREDREIHEGSAA